MLLYKTMIKRIYPPHIHIFCICISFFSSALVVFTSQESGLPLFSVAHRGQTRIKGKKKSSLRVSRAAVGNALEETRREENAHAFPAQCRLPLKLPTFRVTIALQLLQIVMVTKRLLRLLSVSLSYFVAPFIVQFCGFEIRIHFKYFRPSTSERIRIC